MRPYSIAVAADAVSAADTTATDQMVTARARDALSLIMMFLPSEGCVYGKYGGSAAMVSSGR
jgi:hypothetical protein